MIFSKHGLIQVVSTFFSNDQLISKDICEQLPKKYHCDIDVKTGDPSLHVVWPPVLPGVRGAGGGGEPGQVSCDWWVRGHVIRCSPLIGQARGPHPPRPAPRLPRRPRPLLLAAEAAARAAGPLLRGRGLPARGRGGGGRVREEWGDQRGLHLPRRRHHHQRPSPQYRRHLHVITVKSDAVIHE